MELKWSSKAVSDLNRVHDFLAAVNAPAATRTAQNLAATPKKLIQNPRLGERLDEFAPREIRRLLIGDYELRYEIQGETIFLLRIWHTRENRI